MINTEEFGGKPVPVALMRLFAVPIEGLSISLGLVLTLIMVDSEGFSGETAESNRAPDLFSKGLTDFFLSVSFNE